MKENSIPVYTLEEIIKDSGMDLNEPNVLIVDIDPSNVNKIKCNYPTRSNFMGLMIFTKGTALVSIDSQEIELKERDVICMFPSTISEFIYLSPDCCVKGLLIAPHFLSELNFQINSQEAFDILSNNFSKVITLDQVVYDVILGHLNRLMQLNTPSVDNLFYYEMIKMHMMLVIYEIANYNKKQLSNHNILSSRKESIAIQFVNLVGKDFRKNKEVQYFADSLNISRKHLTRTIKEVFDKVPKQIIEDKVIAEAKLLLLKKELDIRQVMFELNFEDQAVFSKYFKKNTGYTPTAYRKIK